MPRAPSSFRPATTSSGMRASRSMRAPSTVLSQNARSLARNSSPRRTDSSSGSGWGWMRSSRKRPRNSSLAKLGLCQSCCRAASATWRASRSVTVVREVVGADMRLTSPRRGMIADRSLPTSATGSLVPETGRPHHPSRVRSADIRPGGRPMSTEQDVVSRRSEPLKTSVPETYFSLPSSLRRTSAWVKSSRFRVAPVVLVRRTKEYTLLRSPARRGGPVAALSVFQPQCRPSAAPA